ncbi:MAG: hypothetical protein AB7V62_11695 [Thermoleophilia bacterium]
MSTGSQYVTAAYGVVLFALLIYVVAVGLRAARVAREAEVLARVVGEATEEGPPPRIAPLTDEPAPAAEARR